MGTSSYDTVTSSPLATSSPLVHGRAATADDAPIDNDAQRAGRRAGILLHVTNLPGPDGVGDLGAPARGFVEWLARAGQRAWQPLPLQVASDMPGAMFAPSSAFAGDPLLLGLDDLVTIGLLPDTLPEIRSSVGAGPGDGSIDPLTRAARWKLPLVRQAARQLLSLESDHELVRDYLAFCEREAWWLADHVAFTALCEEHRGVPRSEWPVEERARRLGAHRTRSLELGATHEHPEAALQFLFDMQLRRLHAHAQAHDVWLVADVPMYVADHATDVWAHPDLFQLDDAWRAAALTGAPPDAAHPAGEVWPMPAYAWDNHKATGYEWWIRRLRHARATADVLRLDGARSIADWWRVPPRAGYGEQGRWSPGPGAAFLDLVRAALDPVELVLDDHGMETDALRELRRSADVPSARVLARGFDEGGASMHLPPAWTGGEVAYTGDTHSGTVAAWTLAAAADAARGNAAELSFALRFVGAAEPSELPRAAIETLMRSNAALAIVPLGDWLGAAADGAGPPGDRRWVATADVFSDQLAAELAATSARARRTTVG